MPAQTARTPGNGTGSLTYTLTSDSFDVESVFVSIDASAAGSDVTAELTIKDQSGVVIARKKQAGTITAGTSGSATWALRLDDESTGGADLLDVKFDTSPQPGTFLETTTSAGTSISDKGTAGGSGVYLYSDDNAAGGGFIGITTADGQVFIQSKNIRLRLAAGASAFVVQDHSAIPFLTASEDRYFNLRLGSGTTFELDDAAGNAILKVTDGGGGAPTYEIKAGAVWTATL